MPLIAPKDYSKVYLCAAAGVCVALIIFSLRADQLPTVGDIGHKLPYGGHYKDGTKEIFYGGSKVGNSQVFSKIPRGKPLAFALLTLTVLCLHVGHWINNIPRRCSCHLDNN